MNCKGADAVMADLGQHAVGIDAACADLLGDEAAQLVGVRQQVLEDGATGSPR
jgi:hypothetical protein